MKIAIPSHAPGGLDAEVSEHFGRCEFFTVVEIESGVVKRVDVIENRGSHFGFTSTPAEVLASGGLDALVVKGMGPKALGLLRQRGIMVYLTSASKVGEAVQEFLDGRVRAATMEDACGEAREPAMTSFPSSTAPFGGGWGMGRRGRVGFQPPGMYSFGSGSVWGPKPVPPQAPLTGRFKVGVASQGSGGLDDLVSPVFGRCNSFTLVEVEDGKIKGVKVIPNPHTAAPQGVGIAVAQMLAGEGVKVALAGRFGPWASTASVQFGIQLIMVPPGMKVGDAVARYVINPR